MNINLRSKPQPNKFLLTTDLMLIFFQIGATALIGLALAIHAGNIVYYIYSPLALLIGIVTYIRSPMKHYLSFGLWVWFLTPFVRRVVDLQTNFHVTSLVMLAPVLVNALSIITVIRMVPLLGRKYYLPFTLIILVCLYGAIIGIPQAGFSASMFALLNWLNPACIALHIMSKPKQSEVAAKAMFHAMTWGALVMGAYGLLQYFAPPAWDLNWIIQSKFTTAGNATVRGIRLFSTLNSPGPFAFVMAACIPVMLGSKLRIKWIAMPLALASFMLSLVRSAWLSCCVVLAIVFFRAPTKTKMKYLAVATAFALVSIPVVTMGPIAEVFQARMQTMATIQNDGSFNDRLRFYESMGGTALGMVMGKGLGTTGLASRLSGGGDLGEYANFDSGVMDLFFTFGWSAIVVFIALFFICKDSYKASRTGEFANLGFAVALGGLTLLISVEILNGVFGTFVFPFFGMALSLGINSGRMGGDNQVYRRPNFRGRQQAQAVPEQAKEAAQTMDAIEARPSAKQTTEKLT